MLGMIIKDLLMIRNNYRSIIMSLLIFIFYSVVLKMDMSFFLPFMGFMMCVSTINYDEYNNWYAYSTTFPQGKINIVKSKYLISVCMVFLLALVSFLFNYFLGFVDKDYLSLVMGELFAIIFMMCVMFPVLFKFGYEKGRIAMILVGLIGAFIIFMLKEFVNINDLSNIISFVSKYFYFIFIFGSLFLIVISYFISRKIYLSREF